MSGLLKGLSWMIFAGITALVAGAAWIIYRLGERTVEVVDRVMGDTVYVAAGGTGLFAFVLVVVGGSIALVRWMARRSAYVYPRDGMYPAIETGRGRYSNLNETGAQSLAVMTAAGKRPTAALAGRVIDRHYGNNAQSVAPQIIDAPTPARAITVQDVVTSINPRTSPHWLLIGSTGSGKSIASFSILEEMARRAACEFIITEPGGVNWGTQAIATRTNEIASVIIEARAEMERRQELLRAEDVDHIEELSEPPRYMILVTEEMDAVLDELKLTDLKRRTETLVALRAIARMGRKPGVCLLAVSQSGTTDVFDAHVRKNMSNVLLFNSEHTVNEMWRLPGVRLNELPTGTAYSVRHASTVQFPFVRRPMLPAPGQSQPHNRNGGIPVQTTVYQPETALQPGIPVFSTDDRAAYSPAQVAYIMRLYQSIGTIKGVQREIYPDLEPGGWRWYQLREVIEQHTADVKL